MEFDRNSSLYDDDLAMIATCRRSKFLDYHEVTLEKFGSLLLCRLCEPRCFEPVSYRVCCSSKRSKDIGSIWRLGIVRWMYSKPKGTNLIFGSTVQCYRGDNITTLAKQQPNQAYTEPACT